MNRRYYETDLDPRFVNEIPAAKQIWHYKDGLWRVEDYTLSDHTDVDTTGAANGNILQYVTADTAFKKAPVSNLNNYYSFNMEVREEIDYVGANYTHPLTVNELIVSGLSGNDATNRTLNGARLRIRPVTTLGTLQCTITGTGVDGTVSEVITDIIQGNLYISDTFWHEITGITWNVPANITNYDLYYYRGAKLAPGTWKLIGYDFQAMSLAGDLTQNSRIYFQVSTVKKLSGKRYTIGDIAAAAMYKTAGSVSGVYRYNPDITITLGPLCVLRSARTSKVSDMNQGAYWDGLGVTKHIIDTDNGDEFVYYFMGRTLPTTPAGMLRIRKGHVQLYFERV